MLYFFLQLVFLIVGQIFFEEILDFNCIFIFDYVAIYVFLEIEFYGCPNDL